MMRRFLTRIALFSAPLATACIAALAFLHAVGELPPDPSSYYDGSDESLLVGFAFNEEVYPNLKYQSLVERGPVDVAVFGSSRVLQLREEMFSGSFFNAGFVGPRISDYRAFWSSIPRDKRPRLLLVGLDPWLFTESRDILASPVTRWTEVPDTEWASTLKAFASGLAGGDWRLGRHPATAGLTPIGYNAWRSGTGFRSDGSLLAGQLIQQLLSGDPEVEDFRFADTLSRIAQGTRLFEFGDRVNPPAIDELTLLLETLRDEGVPVIVFLPPFAPPVRQALIDSGNHRYIDLLPSALRNAVEQTGAEFFDFTTAQEDFEGGFLDGFHGSEVVYAEMLMAMADESVVMAAAVDLQAIERVPMNLFEMGGDG